MAAGEMCRFGVLTASDRASAGDYEDLSGPAIVGFLEEALTSPGKWCEDLFPMKESKSSRHWLIW